MRAMSFVRPLAVRAVTLIGVLLVVLVLLVVSLGATGFSDRMLRAVVGEEVRGLRTALAETIRDPAELERAIEAQRGELERFYGLDRSWYTRLPDTVLRVITLDLGEARTLKSSSGSSRVADIILERLPNTALLLTTALVITAAIGLVVGSTMAARAGTKLDRALSYFAATSFAIPAWWLGILMILLFAFQLRLLPAGGMYSTPPPEAGFLRFLDLLWHAVLPVFSLVLVTVGPYLYSVRTMTLSVAQEDHVMVARAKGLPEGVVVRRHILRVAAPPIVTGLILGLTGSLGGSILIETVFNWRGMGRLYFDAVAGTPDEAVIVALTFVFTLLYVAARWLLEVLYVLLDPRVRYT
ncbi:MAG: ABC transporter permease [Chloroflexi bacterium]|nr:ABC transporter permease [Chloroflexota bacterium]